MGCLYKLTFPNGKGYIGISRQSGAARLRSHIKSSREGSDQLIHKAIRKHGAPVVETLAIYGDWDSLCIVEKRAIAAYDTRLPHGYNMTSGGEGVSDPVGVVRAKISAAAKAQWLVPGAREANAVANKAAWSNPELRAASSESRTKQWETPEYRSKVVSAVRAGKARQSMFYFGAVQVRSAFGQCLSEGRECSRIA